ncbi:hypothetical protein DFH06DRAFT_1169590 [Mycena polygramma]|nr:hypothetical protein DFH06DRAFT_1169590 [Mycena polygramma]
MPRTVWGRGQGKMRPTGAFRLPTPAAAGGHALHRPRTPPHPLLAARGRRRALRRLVGVPALYSRCTSHSAFCLLKSYRLLPPPRLPTVTCSTLLRRSRSLLVWVNRCARCRRSVSSSYAPPCWLFAVYPLHCHHTLSTDTTCAVACEDDFLGSFALCVTVTLPPLASTIRARSTAAPAPHKSRAAFHLELRLPTLRAWSLTGVAGAGTGTGTGRGRGGGPERIPSPPGPRPEGCDRVRVRVRARGGWKKMEDGR